MKKSQGQLEAAVNIEIMDTSTPDPKNLREQAQPANPCGPDPRTIPINEQPCSRASSCDPAPGGSGEDPIVSTPEGAGADPCPADASVEGSEALADASHGATADREAPNSIGTESNPDQSGSQPQRFRNRVFIMPGMMEDVAERISTMPARYADAEATINAIQAITRRGRPNGLDIPKVISFGSEFYADYEVASGVLANLIGPDLVLRAFRSLALVWEWIAPVEDIDEFHSLDSLLVLYRAGSGPIEFLVKGISWSRTRRIAALYMDTDDAIMVSISVPKSEVLAYSSFERECIVDPDKIRLDQVSLVEDPFAAE